MNRITKMQFEAGNFFANAFKVTTLEARESISELMACLVYISTARTARTTQRKPVSGN